MIFRFEESHYLQYELAWRKVVTSAGRRLQIISLRSQKASHQSEISRLKSAIFYRRLYVLYYLFDDPFGVAN